MKKHTLKKNILALVFLVLGSVAQETVAQTTSGSGVVCTPYVVNGQSTMRCVGGTGPARQRPPTVTLPPLSGEVPTITPPAPPAPPIIRNPRPPNTGEPVIGPIDPNVGIDPSSGWGSGPVVGVATTVIPAPPGVPMMGSKIMLRPGDVGGPYGISGVGCGSKAYGFNVPSDAVSGNWSLIMMRPGYSMSFAFTPRQMQSNGIGRWNIAEHEPAGRQVTAIATISESPCDWDYVKMAARDGCQLIWQYGYYVVEGMIDVEAYKRATGATNICVLKPDKTYYFNLRWEDYSRNPGVDDCYDRSKSDNFCAVVANP